MTFCPEHPKQDQNPKFTSLSKMTSIPVHSIREYPPQATGWHVIEACAMQAFADLHLSSIPESKGTHPSEFSVSLDVHVQPSNNRMLKYKYLT